MKRLVAGKLKKDVVHIRFQFFMDKSWVFQGPSQFDKVPLVNQTNLGVVVVRLLKLLKGCEFITQSVILNAEIYIGRYTIISIGINLDLSVPRGFQMEGCISDPGEISCRAAFSL